MKDLIRYMVILACLIPYCYPDLNTAWADPPSYLTDTQRGQSLSGLNLNWRDLSREIRDIQDGYDFRGNVGVEGDLTIDENATVGGDLTVTGSLGSFVNRGDPATWDFDQDDLTMDASWRDLDLSSIVATGAKAVLLSVWLVDNSVSQQLYFRKNGNSNAWAIAPMRTQVANVTIQATHVVPCDTSQVIEYYASAGISTIYITVMGWWK